MQEILWGISKLSHWMPGILEGTASDHCRGIPNVPGGIPELVNGIRFHCWNRKKNAIWRIVVYVILERFSRCLGFLKTDQRIVPRLSCLSIHASSKENKKKRLNKKKEKASNEQKLKDQSIDLRSLGLWVFGPAPRRLVQQPAVGPRAAADGPLHLPVPEALASRRPDRHHGRAQRRRRKSRRYRPVPSTFTFFSLFVCLFFFSVKEELGGNQVKS